MIKVTIDPMLSDLLCETGVTEAEIDTTVNSRDKGMLIPGNPSRMGAIHWFGDDIVFVDGRVTDQRVEGTQLQLRQVKINIALRLKPKLPAGTIDRSMEFEEILKLVASSFGIPVKGGADGAFEVSQGPEDTVIVQGSFDPRTKRWSYLWALSFSKYLHWRDEQMF